MLPSKWPTVGQVAFENVNMRYRAGLPLVLQDLNLVLNGGTKVGKETVLKCARCISCVCVCVDDV